MRQPRYIKGLVSIGIPTYNRPVPLRRALEVAVSQTYKDLEIIVSDNGSEAPEVGAVIREYAESDPRIKCYRQEKNIGLLPNTEFVLKKSSGEYFAWLSDDDWRSPEFVEKLVAELEKDGAVDLAFCEYHEVREDGSPALEYPRTHLPVFRPFQSRFRYVRTFSYYLQDSFNGKCNLLYAVFRKAALDRLDFKKISGDYSNVNTDSLLVYNVLQRSRAAIVPAAMCTLTCGNPKHYSTEFAGFNEKRCGILSKLRSFSSEHIRDAIQFTRNSGSAVEKVFITAFFLPRFLALFAAVLVKKLAPAPEGGKAPKNSLL